MARKLLKIVLYIVVLGVLSFATLLVINAATHTKSLIHICTTSDVLNDAIFESCDTWGWPVQYVNEGTPYATPPVFVNAANFTIYFIVWLIVTISSRYLWKRIKSASH
jgi:hypothetical protein